MTCRHFPQGKCGLKSACRAGRGGRERSLPSGEVWIEIECHRNKHGGHKSHFPQGKCGLKWTAPVLVTPGRLSLPSGEVWIEIKLAAVGGGLLLSLPSGEVWIEIFLIHFTHYQNKVTSLRGSVD